MKEELIKKYDKKTEQVLNDCVDLPIVVSIIVGIALFVIACVIAKSIFGGLLFIVCGGVLIPVGIYYALTASLCNLYQNTKK